jgi:dUTP pyrophosphatase
MIKVKIINKSDNPLPAYLTEGSAGMDLYAKLEMPILIHSLCRVMIKTGVFIELPIGYEAQIRPRSGLGVRHGVTIINTPGTIDSDYRGEIIICLVNLSTETFRVENGDRIGQMIVARHEKVELSNSERGSWGFGHTGV